MSYYDYDDYDDLVAEGREERRRSHIDMSDPQNHEDWMDEEDTDDEGDDDE